jgi:ABC-type transport system involved in multi-copper enzyme maturation permease subunit
MKSVWAIAQIGLKKQLRNKVLYFIFALTLLSIFAGRGCNTGTVIGSGLLLNKEMRSTIIITTVFHIITFWGLGLCGLIASGVLPKELEDKTALMVLSRPISRTQYLFGKLLSVLFISTAMLFSLGSIFIVLLYFDTGYAPVNIIPGFIMLLINYIFVAVSSFCLSLCIPRVIVPFIGLLVYLTSISLEMPFYFNKIRSIWEPSAVFTTLHALFPQLGGVQFLCGSFIQSIPSFNDCLIPLTNVILYSFLLWILVIVMFGKKQL